ncbi:aspartyl/asparaginyl beta-hydroxylase domain-containing protein [Polaribacter sp. Z022]|uniref:aspartyl/asparaginyl beta-hydroxylase domain-containing protein n=1 Tax=Polaribacter sp. Z022 TaxID=2927125 RepID=UPI0020229B0F|nr:aspartyl/asparaginyl beta-hydroxylase domain-containing protein [Polaribacter sp. Z022]MCL7754182.1 aspartyl/asparaginyl beta-hydroxylase domain-containing protein [Polaribacter sp. Z022]
MFETKTYQIDIKDRVQLPFKFNVTKMLTETKALATEQFEYYKVIQLRAPAHLVDTSLPFPPPAKDYADGSWTKWLNTNSLEKSPYLKSIIEKFQKHTSVTLVRLLRLAPNSEVKEHTDPTLGLEVEKSVIRLTIPILNNDKMVFNLNKTPVNMKPGECWYLDLTKPHEVLNNVNEERINLTIDIIPNDWLKELIKKSQ